MIKGSVLQLEKGLNKVTTGIFNGIDVAHCDTDGVLTVTWSDNTTSDENFIAGEDRDISHTKGVVIVSGMFSFSSILTR